MRRWFYTHDYRQRLGPVTSEELRKLAASGALRPDSMVMPESGGKWLPAAKVRGLFPKAVPAAKLVPGTFTISCPGCGRAIPLQEHELTLTFQCA
jgi:hypothetical protein